MKKYRVMYRLSEHANDSAPRTEEVAADGWRVDPDAGVVLLYQEQDGKEERVFDIPKKLIMRIHEI